ncbi:MAG: S8 family peptidase [Bacteroidales bacterium]|nr:S8 family peptidase [Bacteroidales bacterium]
MRRIVFFVLLFSVFTASAQKRNTVETRAFLNNFSKAKSIENMSKALLDRYPLRETKEGPAVGVLAKVDATFKSERIEAEGVKVTSRVGNIVSMRVPVARLQVLETAPGVVTYTVAHRVAPEMDKTRVDTRTDSVQAGLGLPMPFNGKGVLIGITDWGFDYTHPNINKRTAPRILRAWDHFRNAGPAPEGFDYGTELIGFDTLTKYKGDTSGLYGYGTHGTHVAGICGGEGCQGHVIGQAPGAEFILGSWFLDEASWMDQVVWMKEVAKQEGKRLVINSSWGMYTFSTLDGTSLLSQAIDALADSGIVFVTSGGNNGDANFHLGHDFNSGDTLTSIAVYQSGGVGQALIYWGDTTPSGAAPKGFKVGFAMINNNNSDDRYYSPLFSTDQNIDFFEDHIIVGGDTVRYDVMTESSNPFDSRPHALLNVDRKSGYRLMMMCVADSGTHVDVWNVGNVQNHAGNTGCNFINAGVFGCQNGDKYFGVGEPGCAKKTLTVAAHVADSYNNSGDYTTGELTYFSSFGPALGGGVKPEISAPGYNVISSISSWCSDVSSYTPAYSTVLSGKHYIWSGMSGTSMSSPAVTGIVALMLEANPHLTTDQVREILFATARNDDKTGPLRENDSTSICWGYGKADALRAVSAAYDLLGVEEATQRQPDLVAFPNPTSGEVLLRTGSNKPLLVQLFSANGQCVMQQAVACEALIDLTRLPAGVYYARVQDPSGVRTAKVVKE